VCVTQIH